MEFEFSKISSMRSKVLYAYVSPNQQYGQQYSEMRLSRKFQVSLSFFTKRFCAHKKHQTRNIQTFTLLENCARKKLLPQLLSVWLILFCWLMFVCECFLCVRNLFVKKINRLKNVLITSFYQTTGLSLYYTTTNLYAQSKGKTQRLQDNQREKPNDYIT